MRQAMRGATREFVSLERVKTRTDRLASLGAGLARPELLASIAEVNTQLAGRVENAVQVVEVRGMMRRDVQLRAVRCSWCRILWVSVWLTSTAIGGGVGTCGRRVHGQSRHLVVADRIPRGCAHIGVCRQHSTTISPSVRWISPRWWSGGFMNHSQGAVRPFIWNRLACTE